MTIKLTILFLLCSAVKETLNPQAFFWAMLAQKCVLFAGTIPVLLWLSDSLRAKRLRLEVFNSLPILDRLAGITIPLWALWSWFDARAKTPSYRFLGPYVPDERAVFIAAGVTITCLFVVSKISAYVQKRRERKRHGELHSAAPSPKEQAIASEVAPPSEGERPTLYLVKSAPSPRTSDQSSGSL